jgi:beta-galactosidase
MKNKILFCLIILSFCFIDRLTAQYENKIRLTDKWEFLKGDLGGIWEAVRPAKIGDPECLPIGEKLFFRIASMQPMQ